MRTLFACLVAVVFAAPSPAAEPIKLKLEDFKFELAEGLAAELAGHNEGESKLFFYVPGTAVATFKVAEAGEYTVTVSASCDEGDGEKAKMRLQIGEKDAKAEKAKDAKKDGDKKPDAAADKPAEGDKKPDADKKAAKKFALDKEITLTETTEKEYTVTVKLKAGENKVVIAFTNDAYKENEFDRNLYVHGVKLEPAKAKAKVEKDKESRK